MSTTAAETGRRGSGWQHAVPACLAVLAAWGYFYQETFVVLYRTWGQSEAYGHWVLMVPLCAYLVWAERRRLARHEPRPAWLALAGMAALVLLWLAARLVDVNVVQQLAVHGMLLAASVSLLGWTAGIIVALPLLLLVFVIPVWSHFIPLLQDHTATAAARSLQALGVPVYHEGYYLTIPNGQFVVAEVCAGLRFLLATLCICALYALMNLRRFRSRAAFLVIGVIVAVVSNWVRVDIIILLGHIAGMDHPLVGSYHTYLGWAVFAAVLIPLFAIGAWLQRMDDRALDGEDDGDADADTADADDAVETAASPRRLWSAAAVAVLVLGLGPFLLGISTAPAGDDGAIAGLGRPAAAPGWTGPEPIEDPLAARYVGATSDSVAAYGARRAADVVLQVAYYAAQGEGRELVGERNRAYDPERWSLALTAVDAFDLADGTRVEVRLDELRAAGEVGRLRLGWFVVGGQVTASATTAKLLQLRGLLSGRPEAAAVAVHTTMERGRDEALERLRAFAALHWPAISVELGG